MSNSRSRRNSVSITTDQQPQPQPRDRRNSVSFHIPEVIAATPTPIPTPTECKLGLKSLDQKINNIKSCECDTVKSLLLSDAQNRQKVFDLYKVSSENAISNLQKQVEKLTSQLRDLIEN